MNTIAINFDNAADFNIAYKQLKKQYPKNRIIKADIDIAEMLDDEYLLALAMERLTKNGQFISHEEMWGKFGIGEEDAGDVEADEFE